MSTTHPPTSPSDRGFEIRRRRPWLWAVAAAAIAALVVALVVALGGDDEAAAGGDHFGSDLKVAYLSTDGAQQAFLEYVASEIAPDYDITIDPSGIGDPNQLQAAVSKGEIAATIYAHAPWLKQSDAANGTHVTATEPVFQWAYSLWSSKYDSIEALPDGASIALLDDPANTSQALQMLASNDVITLKDGVDPATSTLDDIESNPRHFDFKQIAFGTAARTLDDFDGILSYNFEFTAAGIPVEEKIFAPPAPRVFAAQLGIGTKYVDEASVKRLIQAFGDPRVQDYLATTADPAVQGQLAPVSPE
jgi:D-methionine transport system substrate-binding protein